jgi:hypothetical protein
LDVSFEDEKRVLTPIGGYYQAEPLRHAEEGKAFFKSSIDNKEKEAAAKETLHHQWWRVKLKYIFDYCVCSMVTNEVYSMLWKRLKIVNGK